MTIPTAQRSSARTWLAMVPMLLGGLVGALAISATTTALPAMRQDLHMTDAAAIWIVDIYPLALAVTLVIAARAGDQFGRRTVMAIGLAGFALFNLIGGMTDSALVLIAMRALLGASEAAVIASVVSTIGAVFQPGERVLGYGLWTATFGAGSAFGPVAGGILAEGPGWRWTLYGGIPLVAACGDGTTGGDRHGHHGRGGWRDICAPPAGDCMTRLLTCGCFAFATFRSRTCASSPVPARRPRRSTS